jgi:hypothetical protein
MWSNHTSYDWQNNPGYLYTEKGINNGKYTIYPRPHGALGTHQSCAWKLGGRAEDDKRSLFEICAADEMTHKDPYAHWDYLHFPYVACPVKLVSSSHGEMREGQWYGMKAVHLVTADKKSSMLYLYEDTDPFDSNGKPKNNWKLIATAQDRGCSGYNGIPCTWKSHKDLVRVDGFENVDFALMSCRSIDPNTKPVAAVTSVVREVLPDNAKEATEGIKNSFDSVETATTVPDEVILTVS